MLHFYPFPSSIYLPPSVIRPLISALALLYSNSTLHTVSLIYLSSPFLKVITSTGCFGRLKQRPKKKGRWGVSYLPSFHLIKRTHVHARRRRCARILIRTPMHAACTRLLAHFLPAQMTHKRLTLPRRLLGLTLSRRAGSGVRILSHTCQHHTHTAHI